MDVFPRIPFFKNMYAFDGLVLIHDALFYQRHAKNIYIIIIMWSRNVQFGPFL